MYTYILPGVYSKTSQGTLSPIVIDRMCITDIPRFLPIIVMLVPPSTGPVEGVTCVVKMGVIKRSVCFEKRITIIINNNVRKNVRKCDM